MINKTVYLALKAEEGRALEGLDSSTNAVDRVQDTTVSFHYKGERSHDLYRVDLKKIAKNDQFSQGFIKLFGDYCQNAADRVYTGDVINAVRRFGEIRDIALMEDILYDIPVQAGDIDAWREIFPQMVNSGEYAGQESEPSPQKRFNHVKLDFTDNILLDEEKSQLARFYAYVNESLNLGTQQLTADQKDKKIAERFGAEALTLYHDARQYAEESTPRPAPDVVEGDATTFDPESASIVAIADAIEEDKPVVNLDAIPEALVKAHPQYQGLREALGETLYGDLFKDGVLQLSEINDRLTSDDPAFLHNPVTRWLVSTFSFLGGPKYVYNSPAERQKALDALSAIKANFF
ncbi:MAG: hypothetical protein HQM16_00600 [Deltaproteobacteria bacterium]|nr:hypothetical protein [Deltaproteobacteria bacterium]